MPVSRYTKEELKEFAKIIMFNPTSTKSMEVILTIAQCLNMEPQTVLNEIDKLTQGDYYPPYS